MALRADRVGVRQDQVDIHGRVTSPSFLNELLEDLPEWTDMPVRVNGTEEVLPSDTSVPVTSPILADIAYPDIRRDNQYFTYRESPTPVDGLAKIKSIKGNTLVWNQLVQNGNFADTSKWTKGAGASSLAISNNEAVITIGGTWNNDVRQNQGASFISGHKYFASFEAKATVPITVTLASFNTTPETIFATSTNLETTFKKIASIVTLQSNADSFRIVLDGSGNSYVGETFTVRNVQIIDLTAMGLDISSPSEFTSLFPLSYYSYNQGSLLSFNGNGIKTVGKNIFDGVLQNGTIDQYGQEQTQANRYRTDFLRVFPNTRYVISVDGVIKNVNIFYYDINKNFISTIGGSLVTTPSDCAYMRFYYDQSILNVNLQLEMLKSGDSPTSYEPYTSSTTSLPISTYFPTGMASAKNAYSNTMVYDELLPTKAIKRLVQYTFTGNETVSGITNLGTYYRCYIAISVPSKGTYATRWEKDVPNVYNYTEDSSHYYVQNSQFWYFTTSSTAQAIMDELSGTKFYYDLATPVELPTMSFE